MAGQHIKHRTRHCGTHSAERSMHLELLVLGLLTALIAVLAIPLISQASLPAYPKQVDEPVMAR